MRLLDQTEELGPVAVDKKELFEVQVVLGHLLPDLERPQLLEELLGLQHGLALDDVVLEQDVVQLPARGVEDLLRHQT